MTHEERKQLWLYSLAAQLDLVTSLKFWHGIRTVSGCITGGWRRAAFTGRARAALVARRAGLAEGHCAPTVTAARRALRLLQIDVSLFW
jgi:hypothetical protein